MGARLRQIRRAAGLTARRLSAAIGKHHTSISKIENGVKQPTEADVSAWCAACSAEDVEEELLAALRTVDSAYLEWQRNARAGLRRLGGISATASYGSTKTFRVHEPTVLPGFLQTEQYIRDALAFWYTFLDAPNDIDSVVRYKMARTASIMRGDRRLAAVLGEEALRTRFGSTDAHEEQLGHLLSCARLPFLSLSIIPSSISRWGYASIGFWIFDDRAVVLETPTARLTVTRPHEVHLYSDLFSVLQGQAVTGMDARRLIVKALEEL